MYLFVTLVILYACAPSAILVDAADDIEEAVNPCSKFQWQCRDGSCISFDMQCDGTVDCPDGTDESLPVCRETQCVPACERPVQAPQSGACILPPYPEHGTYVVSNVPNAVPGQALDSLQLTVNCYRGYGVIGQASVFCLQGNWLAEMPKCELFCKLNAHASVHYNCLVTGSIEGQRRCNTYEPADTVVRPECNTHYYFIGSLPFMRCVNGTWSDVVTCQPDCGKVTPEGEILVIGGKRAQKGEFPWHAGIYKKNGALYMQICGGSLVSNTVVISAAHCFWTDKDKQLPAHNYAVAVGKLYRPWDNDRDVDAQKSAVRSIYLPKRFQGGATNYQDDIAVVQVATGFEYKTFVRPICMDYNENFERWQLQAGRLGKVAGWGLTSENGEGSPVLKVAELPYVDINECYDISPANFKEYITSDKICAGYTNKGTALCQGDSGGGLAFSDTQLGIERYYLRGVVSTAPNNHNDLCDAQTLTTFTTILKHQDFIRTYT